MEALRYQTSVDAEGSVSLPPLGLKQGTPVEVIVLVSEDDFDGAEALVSASESSLAFWDNPIDDEAWNAV